MAILSQHVEAYLRDLRPERSPVMAEMEALAEREAVAIVHWETGRLLAAICRALDPVVLEVGTAIGYSTLHIAEQLQRGRVITLERDPERAAQALDFLSRAGVAERVEIVEGDARETIRVPRVPRAGRGQAHGQGPPGGRAPAHVGRGGVAGTAPTRAGPARTWPRPARSTPTLWAATSGSPACCLWVTESALPRRGGHEGLYSRGERRDRHAARAEAACRRA